MNTWLRSVLALVTISLPLAGCAAQAGSESDSQSLAPALGEAAHVAPKGTLASVDGKFSRWLLSPGGKVTGLMLEDGSVAMVPHHAAKDVTAQTLQPGDAVRVEGFTHEGSPVFAFASVKKGETTIVEAKRPPEGMRAFDGAKKGMRAHALDPAKRAEWRAKHAEGERGERGEQARRRHHEEFAKLSDTDASGTVVALVAGRHGDTRAVVLSDGTVAYAKHDAKLGELVKKGDAIKVSGKGGSYELGKALVIERVTLPSGEIKDL